MFKGKPKLSGKEQKLTLKNGRSMSPSVHVSSILQPSFVEFSPLSVSTHN
jgi:hypothetical protein